MGILKNYWLRAGLVVLTLVLGVFVVVGAMETKEVVADTAKASATTTYFYNGPSTNLSANIMNPSNWGTSQNPSYECGQPTTVPCSLEVPEDKAVRTTTSTRRSE